MKDKILFEATTIKARAQAAARALKNIMAEKTLPEDLRKAAEGLYLALKKKWSDLEAEAEPKESSHQGTLMEKANAGDALFAGLHAQVIQAIDWRFGEGRMTTSEFLAALDAGNAAMELFRALLASSAPDLFARSPWVEAPDEVQSSEAAAISDGDEFIGDVIPLMEKAVRKDGTVPLKLIQPGWGVSGYYPSEVLERDGPQIFTKGLHMYWDHPTAREEAERPERELDDLAAVLTSNARWNANGPAGAGLYADGRVMEHYKGKVDELAPHIGVSIRALGKAAQGEAEGKRGPIITALTAGRSVDFVTAAGAGGEILSLFEAARKPAGKPADKTTSNPGDVTIQSLEEVANMDELQKLQEANATLQTQLDEAKANSARLTEAMAVREAKEALAQMLAKVGVPDATKVRLAESLCSNPPMKDGKLDKEAFKTKVEEAVKVEVKYLTEATGMGHIRGMGTSDEDDSRETDAKKVEESLAESFAVLGLSEKAVQIAVKGRK